VNCYTRHLHGELLELRHQATGLEHWETRHWRDRAEDLLKCVRREIRELIPRAAAHRRHVERDQVQGVLHEIAPASWARRLRFSEGERDRSAEDLRVLRAIRDELADGLEALEVWKTWELAELRRIAALVDRALAG
jgi:type I site-specific restriction endonuclease